MSNWTPICIVRDHADIDAIAVTTKKNKEDADARIEEMRKMAIRIREAQEEYSRGTLRDVIELARSKGLVPHDFNPQAHEVTLRDGVLFAIKKSDKEPCECIVCVLGRRS